MVCVQLVFGRLQEIVGSAEVASRIHGFRLFNSDLGFLQGSRAPISFAGSAASAACPLSFFVTAESPLQVI